MGGRGDFARGTRADQRAWSEARSSTPRPKRKSERGDVIPRRRVDERSGRPIRFFLSQTCDSRGRPYKPRSAAGGGGRNRRSNAETQSRRRGPRLQQRRLYGAPATPARRREARPARPRRPRLDTCDSRPEARSAPRVTRRPRRTPVTLARRREARLALPVGFASACDSRRLAWPCNQ